MRRHTLVSGSTNHTQKKPKNRNTAKKMYVPQAQASNMGGTRKAMAKLFTQLLLAPIEAPRARIFGSQHRTGTFNELWSLHTDKGKTSDTRTHEAGPQP